VGVGVAAVVGVGAAVGVGVADGVGDALGDALAEGFADGDGVGVGVGDGAAGPMMLGATLPIVGRLFPLPNGAWSDGELTTRAASAAPAAPTRASAPATTAPRRMGGRSPVFCGECAQASRTGVI